MTTVTANIGITLDGYTAGPDQSEAHPMGTGFDEVHRWMFETPQENADELDGILGHDAYIMGRNMFGPVRGPWPNADWRGWWGEEPPYHAPVFVLTHYPRPPLEMTGTTFYFVTGGIHDAFTQASAAAGPDGSISIGGGASTLRQYLVAGLVHELRLHVAPVVCGAGEHLWDGLDSVALTPVSSRTASLVTHLTYRVGPAES